jgi:hypothetical protein
MDYKIIICIRDRTRQVVHNIHGSKLTGISVKTPDHEASSFSKLSFSCFQAFPAFFLFRLPPVTEITR